MIFSLRRTKSLSTAVVVLAATMAVGALAAPDAYASTNTNTHDGIVVATPHNRTVHGSQRTTVRPSVHPRRGAHRAVSSVKIAAYRSGRRVASGTSVHLRAGQYKLKVYVTYRPYRLVRKTHTVAVKHDPDYGYPDNTLCTVQSVDADGYVTAARCTSADYPGEVVLASEVPWSNFCPDEQDPYSVGQVLHGNSCATFKPYYTYKKVTSLVRVYGKYRHYATPRRTLIVKKVAAPAKHACTLTSSGSCIRSGEFCPQASYGHSGYDADGRRYVCEGDQSHPHWMLP